MASMTPEEVQAMLDEASAPGSANDLPKGTQAVVIERIQERKALSKTGKLRLSFRVVDPEKRSGFLDLYYSGGAIPKFLLGLKALGFDNETIIELIEHDTQEGFNAAMAEAGPVLGKRVSITVSTETSDDYPDRDKLWFDEILPDEDEEDFESEEAPSAASKAPEAPF